ncbi:MAG: Cof-type HAD-IIB family hydrolase [Lachnospiraceae bacterium]|nr:Cof-type HAD-IIB family hydrolase [Lachnospiraceae bacterium]
MNKKILFFDIDGTLWDWKNEISDSTREAVSRIRKNGHLAFINTGRARGYVRNESLLDIGFDGIISACGTMIEYKGETVFRNKMPSSLTEEIVSGVRRYGCLPILEGCEYLYMEREDFADSMYGQKLIRELGSRLKGINDEWGKWEMQKLSCSTKDADLNGCISEFGDRFDFIKHDSTVVEIVPIGFSKGTGVKYICDMLDIPVSDTYAFGDSINDKEMLLTAGTGIVMGNGTENAKALADYITTSLYEDGIWNACRHFGLI